MSASTLPAIDVHTLLVPISSALQVEVGAVGPDVVTELERRGFDQAPVADGGSYVGIVPTTRLRELVDAGEPLAPGDPGLSTRKVPAHAIHHVGDVLEILEEERAVLITNGTADAVAGMVTISDLNRHSVRKALYDLVSEVESRLATLLVHTLDDEEHALRYLGELDQIRLLGHYHFMRQEGVELSLLAGATLSQLLRIAREEPAVLEKLGYGKSKFKDLTGSLPDLRNQVMHPVRPLIHSRGDVAQLLRRVHRLDDLRTRLRRVLGDIQGAPLL